jgi:putative peptidoglycan lipid II flippase
MFKDTVIVAIGTAASRVTGLLRVIVLGIILGQTALADAFDGANNSPNSIYELLVGGLLAASLVPLFTRYVQDRDDEATSTIISVSVVFLALTTVLAVLAAPLIFRLYSLQPSDLVDPDQYRRAGTAMARIFLIQIFFYGLTALGTAFLNARRRFVAGAWAPVIANVVTISILLCIPATQNGTPNLDQLLSDTTFFALLTLSATSGIAVMALALYPSIRRTDFDFHFNFNLAHPVVRSMTKLSLWTFGYVLTNQIALIVVKNLAEPGSGNQDAYAKAFIFFMLPHSLLTISIATTFVPELVRRVKSGDNEGFAHWLTKGLRWISLTMVPASLGVIILGQPIISALLEYGNFSSEAAHTTARALQGFGVGLAGFSVYIFSLRGFFAHEDTKTPFYINVIQIVVNIVLAIMLVDRHGVYGLALAFGISYLVAAAVVLGVLHMRYTAIQWHRITSLLVPVVVATCVMSFVLWQLNNSITASTSAQHIVELMVIIPAGIITYVAVLWFFKNEECRSVQQYVASRSTRRSTSSS